MLTGNFLKKKSIDYVTQPSISQHNSKTLNLSDTTRTLRTVTTSVTVKTRTIFHTKFVVVFIIYLCTQFHWFQSSIVIAVIPKVGYIPYTFRCNLLVLHSAKREYFNNILITLTSVVFTTISQHRITISIFFLHANALRPISAHFHYFMLPSAITSFVFTF